MKRDIHKGRFFVLEGTNASGKATQFDLLIKRLAGAGYDVVTFDFPQYGQESSFFVREYLRGKYGTTQEVGPYTGSLFYALDRYSVRAKIEEAMNKGCIVLANRFTGSNMAHQGTYFGKPEERRGFYVWLDDLEHRMLKVPRPTRSFILRLDSSTALKLLEKRAKETGRALDMHEQDQAHLKRAVTVYDELSILFPKDFTRIDCVRGGDLLDPEHIHELLWQTMQEDLPEPNKQKGSIEQGTVIAELDNAKVSKQKSQKVSLLDAVRLQLPILHDGDVPILQSLKPEQRDHNGNYAYYVPEGLSDEAESAYNSAMNQLFGAYSNLYEQLKKSLPEAETRAALQGIIPVSILVPVDAEQPIAQPKPNLVFNKLAETMLPSMHAKSDNPVKLVACEPRNEFDLIPYMLYEQSNLSLTDIRDAVETWTYEEKEKVLTAYLASKSQKPALMYARYTFELLTSFSEFIGLLDRIPSCEFILQEPTTRHGFTTPNVICDNELIEDYESCFSVSTKLFSQFIAINSTKQSQYTTLLGTKLHATITFSAANFKLISLENTANKQSGESDRVYLSLYELLKDKQPLVLEALNKLN